MTNLNKAIEATTTPASPAQTGRRSDLGKAISSKNAMKCLRSKLQPVDRMRV